MHLQLCFSLSFCLQLVFLCGFSTSIASLNHHHHKVTLQYSTLVVQLKERPGYSKQILANGSWNGTQWPSMSKMVDNNWMMVPKSFTMEKLLEITPHFPSFKKLVVWGFWLFSMQCEESNPSDFLFSLRSCGNNAGHEN